MFGDDRVWWKLEGSGEDRENVVERTRSQSSAGNQEKTRKNQ